MKSEKTTRPRFARLRKIVAFGLLGLIALGVCIRAAVLHARAEKQRAWAEIQKRLDAIRAAGEPVTADDLAKLHPDPPPERDAALLLAPAVAAVRNSATDPPFFDSTVEQPPKAQPLAEDLRTNIEAILRDNQTALNSIPWDRITNAWFGSGFARGFDNGIDPYRGIDPSLWRRFNWLSTTLWLKAIDEGESGDGAQAVESLRQALALVHTIRSDTILNHLARRSGEKRFCDSLERIINRTQMPANDLAALAPLLSDDHPEGLREAFMSIRCLNIYSMTMIPSLPNSAWAISNASESKLEVAVKAQLFGTYFRLSGRMYSNSDFAEMLDVRAAQIAALKLPPNERFAEFTRLKKQVASEGNPTYASDFFGAAYDWFPQLRLDAEALAKLQVTRVALEVERWRLAHGGRAPDSLADLVPQFTPSIPLDPFDNHPLRYKKLARGFLVYSIGADFTDDGGKEEPLAAADTDHYDITFSVER